MTDFLIIGGGVIGLLTARELRLAGADVTVLERGEPARESSWAGGGIVSPLYPWRYTEAVTALAGWSQAHYPALCENLYAATGIDPELERSGLLIEAPAEAVAARTWAAAHGIRLEAVTRDAIAHLEPALADPPGAAIWMPGIAHVRNPRFAKALRADVAARGVRVRGGHGVTGCGFADGTEAESRAGGRSYRDEGSKPGCRIAAVETPHGRFTADTVIVCAGAWSGDLLDPLGVRPDIRPVKGQMILFRAEPGAVRTIHLAEDRYAIPRRDGRVLFGSTLEETGFDKATTAAARGELWRIATTRFPALREVEVERHWAGLRPHSPSGIPYIARHPTIPNLFVNAGHFRNGIVLGPASARLMADLVLGREPIWNPLPYRLDAPRA
jgi:glycine oxidase